MQRAGFAFEAGRPMASNEFRIVVPSSHWINICSSTGEEDAIRKVLIASRLIEGQIIGMHKM